MWYNLKIILGFFALFFSTGLSGQVPSIVSFATNKGGSSTHPNVSKPSGTVANDLLVVGLMIEKGSSESVSAPPGWTLILRTNNSTDCGMATYYKVAGASEPSSYTFGFGTSSKWCIGISRITNARIGSPIDASAGLTGSGSSATAPSINTTGGSRLVMCFYTLKKSASYSPAAGTTEIYDAPNSSEGQTSNMLATFTQASAGATGNKTASASESERWAAQQIAIAAGSPLPIELVSFKAYSINNSEVRCEWITATESNNDYFLIERTQDGVNYEALGTVDGAGNSSSHRSYTYCDAHPLTGVSYYRLRQVDHGGTFTHSDLVAVSMDEPVIVSLYPNPAEEEISVLMTSPLEMEVEIAIYSAYGQKDVSYKRHLNEGRSYITIPTSNLSAGAYVFRIVSRNNTYLEKGFIKK